jgi:hypothetical protein
MNRGAFCQILSQLKLPGRHCTTGEPTREGLTHVIDGMPGAMHMYANMFTVDHAGTLRNLFTTRKLHSSQGLPYGHGLCRK